MNAGETLPPVRSLDGVAQSVTELQRTPRYRSPGREAIAASIARPLKTTLKPIPADCSEFVRHLLGGPFPTRLPKKPPELEELLPCLNRAQRRALTAHSRGKTKAAAKLELERARREWRKVSAAVDSAPVEELQAAAARASDMLKATGT